MAQENKRITIAKKRAMERRQREIARYYSVWHVGTELTIALDKEKKEYSRFVLVGKNELGDSYYFLLLSRYNRIYLTKIVHNGIRATLSKIVKTSEEYLQNKETFDSWIAKAREEIENEKKEYFEEEYKKHEYIAVRPLVYKDEGVTLYKFMDKHKFNREYYFVVRTTDNVYAVVKVAYYAFPKLIFLNNKELERNKERFDAWIRDAKYRPKKKKEETN